MEGDTQAQDKPEKTLREHMAEAARARWAKSTPEEKSAHAKMMNAKRWPEGKAKRSSANQPVASTD